MFVALYTAFCAYNGQSIEQCYFVAQQPIAVCKLITSDNIFLARQLLGG